MTHELSRETLTAQALGEVDTASAALVPPIHVSTIYEANPDGTAPDGRAYTRADNPTYEHAERLLTVLEGGAACMLFASGSTAAAAVFQSLLPGDHVLVSRAVALQGASTSSTPATKTLNFGVVRINVSSRRPLVIR